MDGVMAAMPGIVCALRFLAVTLLAAIGFNSFYKACG
jgi:hypothetical protein